MVNSNEEVSTEVDARLSFNKDAMLSKARELISLYEDNDISLIPKLLCPLVRNTYKRNGIPMFCNAAFGKNHHFT